MSGVFAAYKESLLDSTAPNLTAVDLQLVAVDGADYTLDLATHNFLDDVPSGARVATSGNLANKTITGGTFDADNLAPAFTAVTGDPFEMILLFHATGSDATARLLAAWDAGTGLPATPNSGDMNVSFTSYIFRV